MNEERIKFYLSELGAGRTQRSRQWVQCACLFAPWLHKSGTDRNPSFGVIVEPEKTSHYYCFTCKKRGEFFALPSELGRYRGEKYSGLTKDILFEEASQVVEWDRVDEADADDGLEPLEESAYGDIYEPAWGVPVAQAYLKNRFIGEITAETLGLGFDHDEQRITFPVRDKDGKLYGFTGRSVLAEEDYPKRSYPRIRDYYGLPKRSLLLGEHLCEPERPMIVVEGLFGLASLIEQGALDVANVVALMGSAMTDAKALRLMIWNEKTYLLVDNDQGGDQCLYGSREPDGTFAGNGAIDKLYSHVPLYVPAWPEDANDPDQLYIEDIGNMLRATPLFTKDR